MRPAPLRRLRSVVEAVGPDARIRLHDPLGVSPARDGLALSPLEWRVARSFDGRRTVAEAAHLLGEGDGTATVLELAARLHEALLLEDEPYERAADARLERFRSEATRAPLGAGREYPRDPFELRLEVGGLVANDWDMPEVETLVAVWGPAAPHRRAGALYARTWSALRSRHAAARVLILGALDCELGRTLVPLDRDLVTPVGTVAVDREGVAALEVLTGRDLLVHSTSLLIERQALFASVILPGVPVVPVLVSALPDSGDASDAQGGGRLEGRPQVEAAVEALERVLELPGRTVIVCASDLQSMPGAGELAAGPGRFLLGGSAGRRLRDTDTAVVDAATRLAPEELYEAAREGAGPRAASRLLAPYLLLRVLERTAPAGVRGSTLGYLQMPGRTEITSAASVAFHV